MEIIQSIIGFFIAIGILVTFHEFGHFYVARLFNVTVLNFSVGFGKNIITKKFKNSETEYSIAAIPLGGYVKMLESQEMDNLDKSNPNISEEFCFDKQSVYKRFLIVAAGPIFNLILAVFFFIVVHLSGITGLKPYIDNIGELSGKLISGGEKHEIISVNDKITPRWQDVRVEALNSIIKGDNALNLRLSDSENRLIDIKVAIDQSILKMEGDVIRNIGIMPAKPDFDTTLGFVEDDSPAFLAGLLPGDKIIGIDGQRISTWSEYVDIVQKNPNNILQLSVSRGTELINLILVPSERIINNKSVGYAGISPSTEALNDYRVKVQYPFFESVSKSFDLTVNYTILTFKMIFKLFSGQANMSNISGPLSIAEFSGKSLSMGYVYFAYLLAVLSISLGVLNLLPIPVLDGGHLVYYTIEMILGKPVSIKYQLIGQQLGLLILVGIMLVAFYNDFLRLFSD